MQHASRHLYQFLAFHSFLIGLFPFYIPVFLCKEDFSISHISYFIALTGVGFCLSLWIWDRVHKHTSFRRIIIVSFIIEFLLMTTIFISSQHIFLPLFALLNGMYNCFFWIIQRVLFFETISPQNSGQKFGNFQIFVFIILKAGIFTGGILLEKNGFLSVYLVSGFIALLGILLFTFQTQSPRLPRALLHDSPLSLSHLIHFRDRFRSKLIFAIDGVFLFLESYFWLISLFLIMRESFWHLGILVIILTLTFSIFFFIIKNTIDRISKQKVYVLAVFLYATSWLLRGWLPDQLPLPQLFTHLVIITFCTSFFRLAFNKRFFDLAKQTTAYHYLFMKSYYSQFFIAVSFAVLGLVFSNIRAVEHALKYSYWLAGCIALVYLLYSHKAVGIKSRNGSAMK